MFSWLNLTIHSDYIIQKEVYFNLTDSIETNRNTSIPKQVYV